MQYITKKLQPISIDDVVRCKKDCKGYPCRSVVVSFDDGFENNYTNAAEILDRLKIPAVFYLSTGMIGTEKLFWVDMLEDCINRTEKKIIRLKNYREGIPILLETQQQKIIALEEIKNRCKCIPKSEKDAIVQEVVDETKVSPTNELTPNYRILSWKQVRTLTENPLFTIGGHSMYHDILALEKSEDMKHDIAQSIEMLSTQLNCAIRHYSYPEGQENHYNQETIDVLKTRGIVCCPSARNGINTYQEDLFHLKRIMPGFKDRPFPYWETIESGNERNALLSV